MAEPKGLLAVWMDVPPQNEEEFNDWYNTDHVPERLVIPGFQSARRYVVQEGSPLEERGADPSLLAKEGRPKYLALYALDSVDVLQTEVYKMALANPTPWTQRVRRYHTTVRNVYRQIFPDAGAPDDGQAADPPEFLLAVQMDVDPEQEAEFNDWYNQEHCPMLLSVPGMLGARRFEPLGGACYFPVDLLRNPLIARTLTVVFLVGMALFGAIAFIPLFVQGVMGATATQAHAVQLVKLWQQRVDLMQQLMSVRVTRASYVGL